ncbi:MAG: LPS-assembly protein LptD [Burkholderiales bacterium]|nr:LPS-assembly protein LptD [Burkholderiales bacterium]
MSARWTPIALAAALAFVALASPPAWGDAVTTAPDGAPALSGPVEPSRLSFSLDVPLAGQDRHALPLFFEADNLEGQPDERVRATGSVRLRQGDLTLHADEVTHSQADNTARALGHVRINRRGDVFSGPELTLRLDTLEGEFIHPTYRFARTGAGGQADLVEFLGSNRLRATNATYSSCTPENTADGSPGAQDWVLSTRRVTLDVDANEGRAEGAVIRFMGVPILGAPVLTFPLTDARKSGWLPPSFDIDNKSGFELAEPYYWNIAPDKDLTLTPVLATRRGMGLDADYRYLAPHDTGSLHVYGLPNDGVAMRSRGLVDLKHAGDLNTLGSPTVTNYDLRWRRVSDDDYWKDFPRGLPSSLTPRLYDSHASIERQISDRDWGLGATQTTLYANIQKWQTLRDLDPSADAATQIINPYQREPQLGVRSRGDTQNGWAWTLQTEFNRFSNTDPAQTGGDRVHAVAQLERPMGSSSITLTPRLSLRGVSYALDLPLASGQRNATRLIPTASLDSGLTLERPARFFGRDMIQTLEPRALYVYTPYTDQSGLPLFDTAPRDLNQYSIFSENDFTGVDRISDANQVTLGVTSRLIEPSTGAETMRLGVFQKVLFADQRVRPNDAEPATQRLSALLLLGSTSVAPHWSLDGTAQFSAKDHSTERAVAGVRYSPGAWRTVNVNYRYTRDSSEQVALGWQWPIFGNKPPLDESLAQQAMAATRSLNRDASAAGGTGCQGTWYSVGRLDFSTRDNRLTDSLLGLEYDAGCWIGRFVAERVSVGRAQASTRFMFQLELVGLSRLGSSPLRALKDNIPGYRLLREDNSVLSTPSALPNFTDD